MLMYGQMINREEVVKICEAAVIRQKAKRIEMESIINNESLPEHERLMAKADLMEMDAHKYTSEMNFEAAKMELQTIKNIMQELEPHRKYSHLPILEANEAAQREEWLGEFKNRIENYLFTTGTIPEDHLRAMRNHPDFSEHILPHIVYVMKKIESSSNRVELLEGHSNNFLEGKTGD